LFVDMDGTLVKSDTLVDSLLVLLRTRPDLVLKLPVRLLHGKAAFKAFVTESISLEVAHLPYNHKLLQFLQEERAQGRAIYLATGANLALARRVAAHLGIFSGVLGSDGATNLTGNKKLLKIRSLLDSGAFDYIGNDMRDLPLLADATESMVANPSLGLRLWLWARGILPVRVFEERRHREKTVRILGTHGVPANYGGFETAAENIAQYLVSKGWRVIVYCQSYGTGGAETDIWHGIERVTIPVDLPGWRGTSKFDWLCIAHACQYRDICLTFGYNTGIFNFRQRLHRIPNIINMDGLEWTRARWGVMKQGILYVNERFAALFGNHLIADHPEIETYLCTRAPKRKISTITYGADPLLSASESVVREFDIEPGRYFTLIARPIPENSILELVQAFSARHRDHKLVVLGKLQPEDDKYHRAVMEAASDEVCFAGPIYDKKTVQALRFYSKAYLHGHTVGGTNPSLIEAMAAGNPVIAHDNKYNRWVSGYGALYFDTAEAADNQITLLLSDGELLKRMKTAVLDRFNAEFTWERVAGQYEQLLSVYLN
jgi:glycosyltransferase involved in cell wall biosynthesis/phosphoserine phosphatase